jgi:predicted Zn-dependent peptidase
MLKSFKLKNGIKVVSYHIPTLHSINVSINTKCGALVENDSNNGVAHFMEHMLVQGTPSLPDVEKFSSYIEGLAGSYGAYTTPTLINFHISLPEKYFEDAIRLSSEVFFEALFVENALEKERTAILTEVKQKMDSYMFKNWKFLSQQRYTEGSPLRRYTGGNPEVLKKLSRENLIAYWKEYFTPDNMYLLVAGKFDQEKLPEYLEKYFEKHEINRSAPPELNLSNQQFTDRAVSIREDKTYQANYLDFSLPSISINSPLDERIKEYVALVSLGKLRNSRLFKLLRYQKGLVYGVSAGSNRMPGMGQMYVSSQVAPANLDEVVTIIANELQNFISNGPTEAEFELVKNYLTSQWSMAFDEPGSIIDWLEDELIWEDEIKLPEDYIQVVEKLTVKDLITLMKKWDLKKLNLTIQGPLENSEENIQKYTQILKILN